MNQGKWEVIQKCASMQAVANVPVSFIVDSPWIPGYTGISTLDYLTIPETWLEANLQVENDFPEAIFLPGFWIEMGMAAEPSGFGCRTSFFADRMPLVYPNMNSSSEIESLKAPNPLTDGLMPIILNLYQWAEPRVIDAGHAIKMVAARGPLAIATHLMGVTDFLLGLKLDPANTHRLIRITTTLARQWLEAQSSVLKNVEGVMLLDDIVGFLSPRDYQEFAHPYLKEIFDAFPGMVKMLHNDMDNMASYHFMEALGVQIFNFTHLKNIAAVRQKVGPNVCLMGNVAPLDVLCNASIEEVEATSAACLADHPGQTGLILSAGGGVSPGTPGENLKALIRAAQTVNPTAQ